ncbi:hypothetical protein [Deinococcus sp. SL84]|uniref:hypothetical protein n=1 Tax=Deinococcus sp. SL84 TaxID=2994663 RepID=UPI00227391FE|nr:hypothetical protein [Deinococcus sp. SL84]MCY1703850.1 hypothetical protein [Deinococcus sp. SL84]
MNLPIPTPEGPYTLRALSTFLEQLTAYYLRDDETGNPYDFRRSVQLLHRVASHYHRVTGIEFARIPGRKSELLSFTREQFELFAVVVYRSVVDGTSYEYTIRRELNLPAEGYGLLVSGAGPVQPAQAASAQDLAELADLRRKVADQAEQLDRLQTRVEELTREQRLTYETVAVLMELTGVDTSEMERRLQEVLESGEE